MGFTLGVLAGWLAYHYLMNRAVMMRYCCILHFRTHPSCHCVDCIRDREIK